MPERAVERDWVSPKVLGKGEMGSALVDLGKGSAFLQSSPSNVSRLFQSPSILLFQFRPREFVLVQDRCISLEPGMAANFAAVAWSVSAWNLRVHTKLRQLPSSIQRQMTSYSLSG